ncbi:MAG: hypothetical protein IRY83_00260 [Chloroflexi bacterium]|nr:hypothetical protein [Chloroflexota bacterium]
MSRQPYFALPAGAGRGILALLTVLLLSAAAAIPAAAATTRTIQGTVVNGTAGAHVPAGLTVTLRAVGQDGKVLLDRSTTVDAAGRFSFADVPDQAGATDVVSVVYHGIPYLVDASSAGTGPLTLRIYETTTSDAAIRVDSANWLLGEIDPSTQQATLLVMLSITNAGDRTYTGDLRGDPGAAVPGVQPRTLRLPLPQGASDFQPQVGLDPAHLLPVAGGVASTAPVLPGTHAVVYTYRVGYADGVVEVQMSLPYPVTTMRFLAPDAGLEFRSDRLQDGGTVQLNGQTYRVLAVDHLAANTPVTVDAIGLPSVPANRLDPRAVQIGGIALILLALAAGLLLGLRPRAAVAASPAAQRRALLESLARLDDLFAAGQIDAASYQIERARQKRALIDLILGSQGVPGESGAG